MPAADGGVYMAGVEYLNEQPVAVQRNGDLLILYIYASSISKKALLITKNRVVF